MIRTYFWYDRVLGWKYPIAQMLGMNLSQKFKVGNAGDIYTRNVLSYLYDEEPINCKKQGNRILTVGSILHLAKPGDVICGAGVKSESLLNPSTMSKCFFHALRGPMSYEVLKKIGADVNNVQFLYDPGLMIRYLEDFKTIKPKLGKRIFIPHYRERALHSSLRGIEVVDIDDDPINIARKICESEVVYTSSLHGIIFSHSLERICIPIEPQTEEPIFKYEDYFSSIGKNIPRFERNIHEAILKPVPNSPLDLSIKRSDFIFPDKKYLVEKGIIV